MMDNIFFRWFAVLSQINSSSVTGPSNSQIARKWSSSSNVLIWTRWLGADASRTSRRNGHFSVLRIKASTPNAHTSTARSARRVSPPSNSGARTYPVLMESSVCSKDCGVCAVPKSQTFTV